MLSTKKAARTVHLQDKKVLEAIINWKRLNMLMEARRAKKMDYNTK